MNSDDEIFRENLEKTLPLGRGVRIVAADARGIFAFEKPSGTLTHPNGAGRDAARRALLVADYSLKNESYAARVAGGKIQKIFVLNRIDSPTSGIVLAATDEKIAAAARRAFVAGAVHKIYFALVVGIPAEKNGVWKNFLRRVRARDGSLRVEECRASSRDALFSETEFSVVRAGALAVAARGGSVRSPAGALLRLAPKTGRTHQLRVQCALRNLPILGDKTYGDFHTNALAGMNARAAGFRLFLHAHKTEISFPWHGETLNFSAESPLPPEFDETLPA